MPAYHWYWFYLLKLLVVWTICWFCRLQEIYSSKSSARNWLAQWERVPRRGLSIVGYVQGETNINILQNTPWWWILISSIDDRLFEFEYYSCCLKENRHWGGVLNNSNPTHVFCRNNLRLESKIFKFYSTVVLWVYLSFGLVTKLFKTSVL